jgi:hypothetical protein
MVDYDFNDLLDYCYAEAYIYNQDNNQIDVFELIKDHIKTFIYSKIENMLNIYKIDKFDNSRILECIEGIINDIVSISGKCKIISVDGCELLYDDIEDILCDYFGKLLLNGICEVCNKKNKIIFETTTCFDGCFICPKCGIHLSKSNFMMALFVTISSDHKLYGIKCCCGKFSYHSSYRTDPNSDIYISDKILHIKEGKYCDNFGFEYRTTYEFIDHLKQ